MKTNVIFLAALLIFGNILGSNCVYQELATTQDIFRFQHFTPQTHPKTYAMVQSIAKKAGLSVPRSVVVFKEEGSLAQQGQQVYFDSQSRLCFSRPALQELSDSGLEGAIALAFVREKVVERHGREALAIFLGVLILYTWGITMLPHFFDDNPKCDKALDEWIALIIGRGRSIKGHLACLGAMALPSFCCAFLYSKLLQERIDCKALKLTERKNIVAAIKELAAIAAVQREEQRIHTIEQLRAAV